MGLVFVSGNCKTISDAHIMFHSTTTWFHIHNLVSHYEPIDQNQRGVCHHCHISFYLPETCFPPE